ncbi:MAG: hypothetical protein N2C14_19975, partial [Planctomycetales bacterium]
MGGCGTGGWTFSAVVWGAFVSDGSAVFGSEGVGLGTSDFSAVGASTCWGGLAGSVEHPSASAHAVMSVKKRSRRPKGFLALQ